MSGMLTSWYPEYFTLKVGVVVSGITLVVVVPGDGIRRTCMVIIRDKTGRPAVLLGTEELLEASLKVPH